MAIFILRHGQAEAQITSDDARRLTNKGRNDTARIVQERIADMPLVQIWASPLVRAQQTAEIALSYFPGLKIQTTDLLVPEANPQVLMNWLGELNAQFIGTDRSLLLVSHQPLVGIVVNQLCATANGFYALGTSSLAIIEVDIPAPGMGTMQGLYHALS